MIAIAGKQYAGKDTLAEMMLEYLPGFRRIGIGDAMKIKLAEIKGITLDEILKNKHLYREELIDLAMAKRKEDEDYWIKNVISLNENLIVPDMRFKRELELFRKNKAIAIRVESSREQRAQRGTLVKETDLTETDLDDINDWDFVVENNGSLEELKIKAKEIALKIKEVLEH